MASSRIINEEVTVSISVNFQWEAPEFLGGRLISNTIQTPSVLVVEMYRACIGDSTY